MKSITVNVAVIFYTIGALLSSCQPSLPTDVKEAYANIPETIDFNFHIRPILSDRCYKCHGPDDNAREAEFRLDMEESAFAKLKESHGQAFKRGSPARSIAWQRIVSNDPEYQMPPPESNLSLSSKEKALIGKWIEQGAEWKEHWAFIPLSNPSVPSVKEESAQNTIDHFILAKLQELGLHHSPGADKERLIRRLSMDLKGLPPTVSEVDEFLGDSNPDAYEKLVDRLLVTDAHAERMTMEWLDVARFGDTQGMHTDAERFNWPWRDWVIRAFKQNLPYDQFITWQLAGDLLPKASRDQRLATVFHRNHTTTSEGGVPDEEFRQKYVQERTNTTATAFMGLTMECASCHDHKFDPISQKEYYQMTAFFNNMNEIGMLPEYGIPAGPVLLLPDTLNELKLSRVNREIEEVRHHLALAQSEIELTKDYLASLKNESIKPPKPDGAYAFESVSPHLIKDPTVHRSQNNSPINKMVDNNPNVLASGDLQVVEGKIGNALRSAKEVDLVFLKNVGTFEINEPYAAGGWVFAEREGEIQSIMGTSGEMGNAWRGWDLFIDSLNRPSINLVSSRPHNYIQIISDKPISKNQWHHVFFTYDGSSKAAGLQLYVDGIKVQSQIEYDRLYRSIIRKWRKNADWQERPVMVFRSGRFHLGENGVFTGSLDELRIFKKYLSGVDVARLYAKEAKKQINWNQIDEKDTRLHYLNNVDPDYMELTKRMRRLIAQKLELLEDVPEIMALRDMDKSRRTYVLNRGQYDQQLEQVTVGTPRRVLAFSENLPKNRLGLAQWLINPENPLTARVVVNRYWQMIFGRGLVETAHDFGTQGALPSHPELLDWLAHEFINSGWDLRTVLKLMVMSATYRQSSVTNADQMEKDPNNIYLSRAPSYRWQAEMIRDHALASSGLLIQKIGGPSVKPYQPEGVWNFGALVSGNYEVGTGDDLYRRSMYTYIRRTSPHPAMVAFDAPDRTVCMVKRENTNTPIQALVMLNDPQFVEAARVLAERVQKEGGPDLKEQIAHCFRLLCGRRPTEKESQLMQDQYNLALTNYQRNPDAADDLLHVGVHLFDHHLDKRKTAAMTIVASSVMNFDETYMKR